jgi:tetratricopeptide (TPR) repeat protein
MKPYTVYLPAAIIFSFLLILPFAVFSQTEEKLKDDFVEAESYFLFEEYKDALPLYMKILQADPENFNINYKIGICYLFDVYQVKKSIPYLEKAVKGNRPDSKTASFKEKFAPPEALYYLGNAYRANNKLNDAIETYEQFKLVLDPAVYDIALVDEQIAACRVAAEQQKNPMYFISANLGEGINDRFEEINPVVSGDEKVLVFTRKLQFYDAVFYSRRENGKWSEPINLTPAFEVDGNTYCTGISYKGDELIVYRSDNFDGNLYSSTYKAGNWSALKKLNGNINTKYWESHGAFSEDGKILYFTSNREGGYGGLDIYRSERGRNGEWGPAINLGPVINSKYNEDTPFITEDGNTLYFSSMGHYNMGGYDIFYSTRLENGQWAKPINAGYPLNTTNNDLFFVPVKDGAFAYYSKYDPDDSYGMADIYRMEVFTDLHPRKFILKGITRTDGVVNPVYSRYLATLINSRSGKIVDQTHLNPDGTYTLDAHSGDFDLQISGEGINTTSDKISIQLSSPSNIIAHSSLLTASASNVAATQITEVSEVVPVAGPEFQIPVSSFDVTTDEAIPIRLDVEKNTRLKVLTLVDGKLVNLEMLEMKRRRFVYMYTPKPGLNTLRFTLFNSNGDSTLREVTINYLPPPDEQLLPPVQFTVLSDSDRFAGTSQLAGGNLSEFMKDLDFRKMEFKTIADLYEYLLQNADAHGYQVQDVDQLMQKFLSQKDLNLFYDEMLSHASDSIVKTLNATDLRENKIFTSDALLDHLFQQSGTSNYSLEELRAALYKIASLNRDPRDLLILFESYSTGKLAEKLGQMLLESEQYPDSKSVADAIIQAAIQNEFPLEELESMLKLAAADMNMHFLSQSLIFISSDNLRQTLLDLDFEKQGISNSRELISYLMGTAEKRNYSKRELLENIDKVRRDPYYFVDLLRRMLAEKATGSLKEFLQEVDIRNLKLDTYEQLISYLLTQSQFQDFNREMVYQLLIDIINPKNVAEFIRLLRQFANERIIQAIDAADVSEFSKPLEVIQYLLSVSEEYHYSERDLLRALLKMLLRKGPMADSAVEKQGWFSRIDKPAFIASLVVVNAIIIILLIVFLVRKKRKNE